LVKKARDAATRARGWFKWSKKNTTGDIPDNLKKCELKRKLLESELAVANKMLEYCAAKVDDT